MKYVKGDAWNRAVNLCSYKVGWSQDLIVYDDDESTLPVTTSFKDHYF